MLENELPVAKYGNMKKQISLNMNVNYVSVCVIIDDNEIREIIRLSAAPLARV